VKALAGIAVLCEKIDDNKPFGSVDYLTQLLRGGN
jgi:hypothetical protein